MSAVEVWVDNRIAGSASIALGPSGQHRMTFTYDRAWLSDPTAFPISPEVPLSAGPHEPYTWRYTPFSFDDAAPDSWGRNLIDAEHRRRAKTTGQRWRPTDEVDLLLAVSDETRQGALRFRENGVFLCPETGRAGIKDLQALQRAAQKFQNSGEIDDDVAHLVGVGSSPGGAQPKAWIRDDDGSMLLAKFPTSSDAGDRSAWELVVVELQRSAGIEVASSRITRLDHRSSIFLTRRFDREGERRIPYQSFKTMFGFEEGERRDYATLAQMVTHISANPKADGAQLFARAALGVMVNNIDDHMRNHGLLRAKRGWRLAPSFDVNPERRGRSDTPLTPEDDPADSDVRLLFKHCEDFLLHQDQAAVILHRVSSAVEQWPAVSKKIGIDPEEVEPMSRAFDTRHRKVASAIQASGEKIISTGNSAESGGSSNQVWVQPHTRGGKHIGGHWRRP